MNTDRTKSSSRNRWLIIVGVWTLNAVMMSSQTYFSAVREGRSPQLWNVALSSLSYSVLWIFLTPLVLMLGKAFPLEQKVRTRNIALHAGFSIAFGILHTAVSNAVVWYMRLKPGDPFPFERLFTTMVGYFDYGVLVYWIILLIQQSFAYYRRVQDRERRALQLETQLVETRLQALKMQLQPHFLFNTLHSISALVHEDVQAADKMIARLGDFLRITLEKSGAQMVTLKSEIESLQCYFEIERVRFREQLELKLDIEPHALDAQVPSFLWQPILENAIRHGIATSETQGRITIRARQNNGTLLLEVEDNGTGLPLNPQQSQEMREGIGLANTRAILQHIYGSHHRFQVAPSPNGGAIATLEIPFKTMDSSNEEESNSYDGNRPRESVGD